MGERRKDMEKLKQLKGKHDHLLTKLLKVFLFSCVMIAPIVAGTSQMFYSWFNKNAKDSYYGETINQEEYIYTDNLKIGETYRLTLPSNNLTIHNTNGGDRNNFIEVSNFRVIENTSQNDISSTRYISFWSASNSFTFSTYFFNDISQGSTALFSTGNTTTYSVSVSFTIVSKTAVIDTFFNGNDNIFYKVKYNNYSYLDNAFYYGMEKMADSELFGWTKQTGIYTTINTMATGLGVNEANNILAVILSYWTLMTCIYVIFDIIIELFVKITHLIS